MTSVLVSAVLLLLMSRAIFTQSDPLSELQQLRRRPQRELQESIRFNEQTSHFFVHFFTDTAQLRRGSSSSAHIQPPSTTFKLLVNSRSVRCIRTITVVIAMFSAPFLFFVCSEISTTILALSLPIFYSFGEDVGDHLNLPNDDGGSGKVQISIPFPFFGEVHHSLFVSNTK